MFRSFVEGDSPCGPFDFSTPLPCSITSFLLCPSCLFSLFSCTWIPTIGRSSLLAMTSASPPHTWSPLSLNLFPPSSPTTFHVTNLIWYEALIASLSLYQTFYSPSMPCMCQLQRIMVSLLLCLAASLKFSSWWSCSNI